MDVFGPAMAFFEDLGHFLFQCLLPLSPLLPAAVGPRYVISDPASTLNVSKVASIVRVAMFFKKFARQLRAGIECWHQCHDLS